MWRKKWCSLLHYLQVIYEYIEIHEWQNTGKRAISQDCMYFQKNGRAKGKGGIKKVYMRNNLI